MAARIGICVVLIPQLLGACTCNGSQSACGAAAISNLVFTGTVDTVEPRLLDRWNPETRRNWLNDSDLVALRKDKSPAALNRLKERYLELLFDLPDLEKDQIRSAADQQKLQIVIAWIVNEGTRVRFKIDKIFSQKKDAGGDDEKVDAKDKDAQNDRKKDADDDREHANAPESLEVWNAPGDCGIAFQKGETYLVYANADEASDRLQTNICQRTARLSDSGEDLAYLYFLQKGSASSRLEGFVTSEIEQLRSDPFRYSGKIRSPVLDVVVELKSDKVARYTEPDSGGRFLFDGLTEGDYQVSAFEIGFPRIVERLSGPKSVHINGSGCSTTTLLVLQHTFER